MSSVPQQETRAFQTEVNQLLQLVVHSLYSNREIFLRELVSNAADAADRLRFEALSDPALLAGDTDLQLKISVDAGAGTLTLSDNGIGMSREEVIANLGTIAKSGTREFLSQLSRDQKQDAHLIGQFGVGFYSAFIVADQVTVITRRAGLAADQAVRWASAGTGEYTLSPVEKTSRGTDVILHLRQSEEQSAKEFLDDWRLRSIIRRYSDHVNLPIYMRKPADTDEKEKAEPEWEQVNRATALWTLPKNDITPAQYQELYHQLAHDFSDALVYAHNRVEGGNLDYTSLLYVPAQAPVDLWQRENSHGLKLYVQRVFIMDRADQFLPNYLRFVRGVLDTNALPLNISREILQENPVIPKLRSALVRRVLDMLEKLAADDSEKYATFWVQFGNVLKEGPAEDFANREQVAKLLRFASTHLDEPLQTVSLAEYANRMRPGQEKIYYITADHFAAAKSSPHLEVFRKKQIEVLLLHDRVDEWMVSGLGEFEKHPLQSVAKGEVDLSGIGFSEPPEEKQREEERHAALAPLLERVRAVLGEEVKDVRFSHRLTASPACLVVDANEMGIQLQRLLKAAGQATPEVKPVLELNPEHRLVTRLANETDEKRFAEWVSVLFDQALLVEGGQLKDPGAFIQKMNRLLEGV